MLGVCAAEGRACVPFRLSFGEDSRLKLGAPGIDDAARSDVVGIIECLTVPHDGAIAHTELLGWCGESSTSKWAQPFDESRDTFTFRTDWCGMSSGPPAKCTC